MNSASTTTDPIKRGGTVHGPAGAVRGRGHDVRGGGRERTGNPKKNNSPTIPLDPILTGKVGKIPGPNLFFLRYLPNAGDTVWLMAWGLSLGQGNDENLVSLRPNSSTDSRCVIYF